MQRYLNRTAILQGSFLMIKRMTVFRAGVPQKTMFQTYSKKTNETNECKLNGDNNMESNVPRDKRSDPMRNKLTNSLLSTKEERDTVKRGLIISVLFTFCLLMGTYYRSYVYQKSKGLLWAPVLFVYAHDDHSLYMEHFFGKFSYYDLRRRFEEKESLLRYMEMVNEQTRDVAEL
jgi:hypothetical protein